MRVAPVGLFLHNQPEFAFEIGCDIAAITHGHPTGYLSAGTFSMIIAELINGKSIVESLNSTIKVLKKYSNHEETLQSLSKAINLVNSDETTENAIALLGEGWVAEEALAIAVYCALRERDFKKALILSVNHNGDSDSTGAICGNILGAHLGIRSIPAEWVNSVELSDFIRIMADRLFDVYDIKNK
jgi:ADP-ribosylglycohydrolase